MIDIELFIAVISLISSIAGLIAAIAGKKHVIEVTRYPAQQDETLLPDNTISPPGSRAVWYNKTGWLVFSFLCFWPIGLYGLYKSQAVSAVWKRAGFIVIFGGLVVLRKAPPSGVNEGYGSVVFGNISSVIRQILTGTWITSIGTQYNTDG